MTLHKTYVRRIEELTLSYCITEVFDDYINNEFMKTSYRHSKIEANPQVIFISLKTKKIVLIETST